LKAKAALTRTSGDADKLKQAFVNVLADSVEYGRPGDRIKICLKPETGGVLAAIQDTGPGIPPQHLPHVTERLYRVHEDRKGSGLGLAIVAEILRLHDARLEIESPSDEETGVKVSFLLPAHESEYAG
jgi:two-component system phosphate regulon sensor histidine kinase PhoR